MLNDKQRSEARKQALINAILHEGKASPDAVIKKLIVSFGDIKNELRYKDRREEIMKEITEICKEINRLTVEKQKELLEREFGITLDEIKEEKAQKTRKGLPPLPGLDKVKQVVTRFAPAPSGALHLGQVLRAAMINYLYAKEYGGKFVLRIEDTDPRRIKKPYYKWIMEDLKAIGIVWDELVYESDHFEIYYEHTRRLFKERQAYVCTCTQEEFQKYKESMKPCPHRDSQDTIEYWEKMLNREYKEKEAVVRIKTDMAHPNPAVRDPPLMRIITSVPHPRTGYRYHIYPLYNYAVVIEDHLSNVSHVIRGKEHQVNEEIQREIYKKFGWNPPFFIEYGMIHLPELKIHKRHIRSQLREGLIEGWDDVTLPTVRALLRRGIHPETFKQLSLLVGVSKSDITLHFENIYSHNRQILSKIAKRVYFVDEPVRLEIVEAPDELNVSMDWIPGKPEAGQRVYTIKRDEDGKMVLFVSKNDLNVIESAATRGGLVRLKDLANIIPQRIDREKSIVYAKYHSTEVVPAIKKIHWVPSGDLSLDARILMPDGKVKSGVVELMAQQLEEGEYVQFERMGFGRVDRNEGELIVFTFAHP